MNEPEEWALSEPERPRGERGARRAGRPALAPAGLSEEWALSEPEGPSGERAQREPACPQGERTQRRDGGTAVVEFVLLGIVLLVPLLYLALTLSATQRTVYGVTQAAREAGRAAVTGTAATASARADHAARLALADQGLPADGVRIRYGSAESGCGTAGPAPWPLRPGEAFAVCVSASLRLPAVPGFLAGERTTVTARHVVQADEHRDYSP